jgi:hypothetical protein
MLTVSSSGGVNAAVKIPEMAAGADNSAQWVLRMAIDQGY